MSNRELDIINVIPIDDLREHRESRWCDCKPEVESFEGNFLVLHNSYDKREIIEQAKAVIDSATS